MEHHPSTNQPIELFYDRPLSYERSFAPVSSPDDDNGRAYLEHISDNQLPELVVQLTPRIRHALEWAAYAHQHQYRKVERKGQDGEATNPHYIEHPYTAMALVAQVSDDEDVIIAAILHDVVEDQPDRMNLDTIEREFGPRVRRIVRDVTKDNGVADKVLRNQQYLRHLDTDAGQDSRIVCAADKIHNLMSDLDDYQSIGEKLWEKFARNGESTDAVKQRKYDWFNGVYEIMLRHAPSHPLTAMLGELVAMYQHISVDTISAE